MKTLSVIQNIFRSSHPIKYVVSRALVRVGREIPVIQHRAGYRLRFFPSRINIAIFYHGHGFYRDEERLVRALLSPGDVFVDVGCNIGLLSLAAKSAVGAEGRCVAFEANPVVAQYARLNSVLNGNSIDVINAALGSKFGLASISLAEPDDEVFIRMLPGCENTMLVPLCRLDDLLPEANMKLLKVDVEGFELEVLKGGVRLLESCDFVYLEICDQFAARFGATGEDVASFLSSLGFSLYIPAFADDACHCERIKPGHDFSVLRNYLASRSNLSAFCLEL